MDWHEANHQHWHFHDFARYRAARATDQTEAVRSTKAVVLPGQHRRRRLHGARRRLAAGEHRPAAAPAAAATPCRCARCCPPARVTPTRSSAPASRSASRTCPTAATSSPSRRTRATATWPSSTSTNNDSLPQGPDRATTRTASAGSGCAQVGVIDEDVRTSGRAEPPRRPRRRGPRHRRWRGPRRRRRTERAGQPLRLVTFSAAAGSTVCRSPTTPKSTSSKIGASSSLLTATIVFEVCMPARCWMAPEMPLAT